MPQVAGIRAVGSSTVVIIPHRPITVQDETRRQRVRVGDHLEDKTLWAGKADSGFLNSGEVRLEKTLRQLPLPNRSAKNKSQGREVDRANVR
jgi:hypothetical protein